VHGGRDDFAASLGVGELGEGNGRADEVAASVAVPVDGKFAAEDWCVERYGAGGLGDADLGSGGEVRRAADSEPATPTLREQTRRKGRGLRGGSEIGILLAEEPRIWRVCRRSRRRSCRRYRLCR